MTTDKLGVPIFSSPRAALVELRADVVQAISQFESMLDTTVDPFAAELAGPAIEAITTELRKTLTHLRPRLARQLVIGANSAWASEDRFYHWRKRVGKRPPINRGTTE